MESDEWIKRYAKHIILPEVGGKGQKKLNKSKALILGAGVLGVLQGLIGAIQGTETIKYLLDWEKTGKGKLLKNRMLIYDASDMSFDEAKYRKDPNCPACGKKITLDDFDYGESCGARF